MVTVTVDVNLKRFSFYEDGTSKIIIDEEIHQWACENAESFAHFHFGWDEPYTEEEYDEYIEEYVDFDWHKITYKEYVKWCKNWGYKLKEEE